MPTQRRLLNDRETGDKTLLVSRFLEGVEVKFVRFTRLCRTGGGAESPNVL